MKWIAVIAAVVAASDQITKWLTVRWIEPEWPVVVVPGFFSLVHWHNPGAAWGVLRDYNLWLAAISLLTILALYLFRHSFPLQYSGTRVAMGMVVGGIIGNFIDRVRWGYVIDFLDFYAGFEPARSWLTRWLGGSHWPAFNVADTAICLGVGLYLIESYRSEKEQRRAARPSPPVPGRE